MRAVSAALWKRRYYDAGGVYTSQGEALLAGLEERFASLKESLRRDSVTAEAREELKRAVLKREKNF